MNFKKLRQSKGITQATLAILLDLKSSQDIKYFEWGSDEFPINLVDKTALIMRVSVSELIDSLVESSMDSLHGGANLCLKEKYLKVCQKDIKNDYKIDFINKQNLIGDKIKSCESVIKNCQRVIDIQTREMDESKEELLLLIKTESNQEGGETK